MLLLFFGTVEGLPGPTTKIVSVGTGLGNKYPAAIHTIILMRNGGLLRSSPSN